jgi:cytochrome c oxidase assembly protein subunit 15
VSDSGLGCGPGGSGTDGWPLCGGRLIPLVDTNMIVEYAHRLLAGSLAIVIAVLALHARRRYRTHHSLQRVCLAAFGLVLFQAALGGLTVEKGLEEELVAAHLGVAMLQLGLLMVVAYLAPAPSDARAGSPPNGRSVSGQAPVSASVRLLAIGASVAVLAAIVAGGYMSANQLHGTSQPSLGVHSACGTDFPDCGGEFLPFGRSRALDIHLTHRALVYVSCALVLLLFLAVLWQRRRTPAGSRRGLNLTQASLAVIAVLALQVLLGALNVWLGEHGWLVIAHLAAGTLLWGSLVHVSLLALRAPRETATVAHEPEMEAVPA